MVNEPGKSEAGSSDHQRAQHCSFEVLSDRNIGKAASLGDVEKDRKEDIGDDGPDRDTDDRAIGNIDPQILKN